jgi:hypothetical protein
LRLYVNDKESNEKIFINEIANTRKQLANKIGSTKIKINNKNFNIRDVKAITNDNTASTMALGGVVGVLGGIPGVIIGGIVGALLGSNSENSDQLKVDTFNKSKV